MTLRERLNSLEKLDKIAKIPVDKNGVNILFTKSSRKKTLAKNLLNIYKNDDKFDDDIFENLYDAVRIALDSLIRLSGFKMKSGGGHHSLTFQLGFEILIDKSKNKEEKVEKLNIFYKKIRKTVEKRHTAQYEPVLSSITRTDLIDLEKDIDFLLKEIGSIMAK